MSIKTKIAKLQTVVYTSAEEGTSLTSFRSRKQALEWANRAAQELDPVAQDHTELADVTHGNQSLEIIETDLVEYFEVPDGDA